MSTAKQESKRADDAVKMGVKYLNRIATLTEALKDGEREVRHFLNCCGKDEIRDSYHGLDKFQKRAAKLTKPTN